MSEFVNVTEFLRQYESWQTRRSYKTGLKRFFNTIYPELKDENLDVLAKRYLGEDREYRKDILNFKDTLKDNAPKTKSSRLNAIRVFLDENGISFPKRFFKNLNGKVTEAITWEDVPTNAELKRVVEYMPIQGKAMALLLSSSGIRIGESVQLKLGDIEFDSDPARIKIRAEYTKTGKRRITFMSSEAKEAIEEWLKYRDQYVKTANARSARYARTKSDCIFPFRAENFNTIWRNALIKTGLFKKDSKTNRMTMRPHNLRKYFRLRVGRSGRDEAEAMMGHQKGLNAIYARFDDAEDRLEEIYRKAIPDLAVYERTSRSTQIQMEKLKENTEQQEELRETLIQQSILLQKMRREKDLTDSRVRKLENRLVLLIKQLRNLPVTDGEIERNRADHFYNKVSEQEQIIDELRTSFSQTINGIKEMKMSYEKRIRKLEEKLEKELTS